MRIQLYHNDHLRSLYFVQVYYFDAVQPIPYTVPTIPFDYSACTELRTTRKETPHRSATGNVHCSLVHIAQCLEAVRGYPSAKSQRHVPEVKVSRCVEGCLPRQLQMGQVVSLRHVTSAIYGPGELRIRRIRIRSTAALMLVDAHH